MAAGETPYPYGGAYMTKVTVAEEWLNSCSGCEIAILNIGDVLVDLSGQQSGLRAYTGIN
jgi:coenzyme F420-reducing hydrogenase gamma subunit